MKRKQNDHALVPSTQYAILRTAPEQLKETVRANLSGDDLSAFDFDRVRVPAGGATQFLMPTLEGEVTSDELTGVIVYWRAARSYWANPFSGEGAPPDCTSSDGITGIGDPGGDCATCQFAQWGSRAGGRGQACKQVRFLFLLTPNEYLPVVLALPPTSINYRGGDKGRSHKGYMLALASRSIPYWTVVTRVRLERTKNADGIAYSRAAFSLVEQLPPDVAERFREYGELLRPNFDRVRLQPVDIATDGV